jgi:hypothetical protein
MPIPWSSGRLLIVAIRNPSPAPPATSNMRNIMNSEPEPAA